ncbi:hypothetical protein BASA81_008399 [Batrachochytrium salamandrivorans]|nr:hypothetical protein BASA81_008399 [Batrachochytrium salamandrivorans]
MTTSLSRTSPPVLATSSGSALEKFLVGGTVAWSYEFVLGHFLEFVKIAKQTNYSKSYLELSKEMVAKKGFVGVWDGFFPWGSLQAVAKGAVFSSAHIAARSRLQPWVKDGKLPSQAAEVIAGGIGGGFQGLVLSPLLLLKTRVMTDPIFRGNMSMWQTCVGSTNVGMSLIRKEGPAALMKGSVMFSVKRVADWSTRYMFAEGIEYALHSRHPDQRTSQTEKVVSSFLGGALSTVATIPMDVMVAQIQQASKAGQKVSAIDAFRAQMKEGGMGAVIQFSMRGLVARVAHVSLTTVVMKTGTEYAYGLYNSLGQRH